VKLPALPAATTFAEGQRLIFGCLVAGAGMFCGGMSIGMIALLMWGHWPPSEYHSIIVIFGWSLGGFIAAMTIVIIGLLVGGPVGRFKGGVSKAGLDFEASSPDSPIPASTVSAAAAGAAAGAISGAAGASASTDPLPRP
jgi:hypothetical protein